MLLDVMHAVQSLKPRKAEAESNGLVFIPSQQPNAAIFDNRHNKRWMDMLFPNGVNEIGYPLTVGGMFGGFEAKVFHTANLAGGWLQS
jgi:hypothetical protein